MRGPPRVIPDQISYGLEGDAVEVDCEIESIPRPTEIEWSRNGVIIDSSKKIFFLSLNVVCKPIFSKQIFVT